MNTAAKRANNRNQELMDAAAKLFAEKGFRETTMRDIAKESGMLPGSIYYHYPSKDALLLAVYEEGVSEFCERFDAVTAGNDTPWVLLTKALESHIESITADNHYSRIINRVMPEHLPQHRDFLRNLRDQYDARFKNLIERLDLNDDLDPTLFRLMILGASNWTQNWFRPDNSTPREIAEQFVRVVKNSACQTTSNKHEKKRK